jgi:hypothetical protein
VADRVREQVVEQALDQDRVTAGYRPVETDGRGVSVQVGRSQNLGGDRFEFDDLPAGRRVAAAQGDAGREHSFLLRARREHAVSNLAPGGDACVGVGKRELEQRPLGGKPVPELMGDVRGEGHHRPFSPSLPA